MEDEYGGDNTFSIGNRRGTGIGLASAEKFAAQGAAVGLLGRTEAKLVAGRDAILRRHPDANVSLFVGDTADEQTVADSLIRMNTIAPLKKVLANAGIGDSVTHSRPRCRSIRRDHA